MGMFSDVRREFAEPEGKPSWEIWVEAFALWCFITLTVVVCTVGVISDAVHWLLTIPDRWKP